MERWKLLLVDDELEFVSTLAERLALRGIDVRTAHSGEEALRRIEDDPPEVVVLDVMMPGMSGLEVLRRVKAQNPEIKIVLLTGIGNPRDGAEGIRLGASDYLMKPLQIEELLEKIGVVLKASP
jgi:DNA-binding response OmpR family regulator